MRLGKTRQFLTACQKVKANTVAVACKATGVYEWEQQSAEAGFNPVVLKSKDRPIEGRFNIMSYNALTSSLHTQLMKMRFDVVGGDESDQMKNPKAKRTKAFYGARFDRSNGLSGRSNRVWLMTGTPVLNHPAELFPMIHALFPDAIARSDGQPMDYWSFVNKYCKTKDNGFGIQIVGGKNLFDLRDKLRGRVLRRTKAEVWDEWLQPVIDILPVPGKLEGIPGEEIAKVEAALKQKDIVEALAAVAEQAPTLRRLTGLAKVNGVMEWVDDNIESTGKIIIFAHHKDVMGALQSKCDHKSVEIIGGMSSEQKYNAYTAFQNDDSIKVFFGQNQAARDSIPLWKASTAISVEPDWVPGNNSQMMDRMSYIDKKDPCVGYYATLLGSYDMQVHRALLRKTEITNQLGF